MFWKLRQVSRFWFCYLNQPIFSRESKSTWRLSHFWSMYQISLLESCWQKSPVKETSL